MVGTDCRQDRKSITVASRPGADNNSRYSIGLEFHRELSLQLATLFQAASAFDAASGVMVVKEFSPSGPPPYRFTLEYNSNWINPDGDYAIRARVDVDGKFTFSGIEKINGEKKGNVLQVQAERVDYSN